MRKLPDRPYVPKPPPAADTYSQRLHSALTQSLGEVAQRSNQSLTLDGIERMTGPLKLRPATVAGLAAYPAADWTGAVIFVSDETGGPVIAFSDGTDWRRVTDGAVVS